jgi:hypothetical protein
MDGSVKLGANNLPLGTYTQQDVKQLSLAFTGWTYATAPGQSPRANNWEYFGADLEVREQNHDTTAKSFLACSLPAGQSVTQDRDGALDCLFQHPNLPPFVASRLIRFLVLSNPSPAYVQRIANVFANNGANVRGDMKAVIQAILLDPEARQDTPGLNSGRLRDAITHYVAFIRAMNGSISPTTGVGYLFTNMGQNILTPNSVFNWYSPLYRIPKTSLTGPEFQIYSPSEAVMRANLLSDLLSQPSGGDAQIDLTPFKNVAGNIPALLDLVDQTLFFGRMSAQMKTSITKALNVSPDNNTRVHTALHLAVTSGEYLIQH